MNEQDAKRHRSCVGKKRYLTRAKAKEVQKITKMLFKQKVFPYECGFCGCWHLGHQSWRDDGGA